MNTRKLIIVLPLAAVAFLPACSGGGSSDTSSTTTTTTTTTNEPTAAVPNSPMAARPMGGPPGMPGGPMGGPPGMPGAYPGGMMGGPPGMGRPGGVFAGGPAQATAAGGVAAAGKPGTAAKTPPVKPIKHRNDPFYVPWHQPEPPPYVFNEVQPLRVASANIVTPPSKPTEVREVPDRRVSGIMSGDGVYAILESGNGEPEIVKPGSLTRDGYRVVSINAHSVKLERKEGNYILTQDVPLTDSPIAPASGFTAPAGYQPGYPGRPGIGGQRLGGKNEEE